MNKRKLPAAVSLALALTLCVGAAAVGTAKEAENGAPVVENLEFSTYRNVSFSGELYGMDPEGDVITYEITTAPVKGSVTLDENGSFVYTPDEGKKGKDYFGYKAVDSAGNASQEGTVIIKIARKAAVTYSDMAGNGAYYDAVILADEDIFLGEKLGASYFFSPEREVTRGEFLSMCMELSGADILSGVMSTGFMDDNDIPAWAKPYVSTAVMTGAVSGYSVSGGAVFDAASPVTRAEATVMLDKLTALTAEETALTDAAVPTWAAQSVANLTALDIISGTAEITDTLTRAEAAQMLVNALEALKAK